MNSNVFEYSVAIRTVGKAGDKYIKELESLHQQTVKPKHIYIHLAEGFERPKEQVGIEEYIISPKGLVHQRAFSADGVDTEYLLILDDDVYFPKNSIENMYKALQHYNADGVAPDTFPSQNLSFVQKLIMYGANTTYGRRNDQWAIKIQRTGAFSYNNRPEHGAFYPTQSAAGTALFIKTEAFKAIHYEHELWVDQYPPGTFGEDQLMFNKLYKNGFKILMAYDTGILHLDANTNKASQKTYDKLYYRAMSQYLTWYRSCCDLKGNSKAERIRCSWAYAYRLFIGSITRLVFSIMHLSPKFLTAHIKGNWDARNYVRTKEYKSLPNFILK